jgi:hypothetical protein
MTPLPPSVKKDTHQFLCKFANDLLHVFGHINEHQKVLKWKPGDSLQDIYNRLLDLKGSNPKPYGPSKYPFEFLADIDREVYIVDFVHEDNEFSDGVIKCIFKISNDPRTFCCQADIQSWGDSDTHFQLPIIEVYPKPVTYTVYQPVEEVIDNLDIQQMLDE